MVAERRRRLWWPVLSVRARTTCAATLAVGLAVLIGVLALVMVLQRSLVSDIDQVAELRATALAELAAQGLLDRSIEADEDEVVQVVDAAGTVVAASRNVGGQTRFSTLHPRGAEAATATLHAIPKVPGRFRVVALAGRSPSGPITVYVATNLKHADATVALQRRVLFLGGPLLVAMAAVSTWLTVGRALRPVEAIRAQVAEISRQDLGRRVPVADSQDEVSRLARTMNEMLDRLQATVEQQRRFVADASHELRTPLAATRADLEVALAHPDDGRWTDTAQALLQENQRMEQLVTDLLYVARADGETARAPMLPVDLHEVVLAEVGRLPELSRDLVDTGGVCGAFVLGHRDDLARVVRNLLDNAVRYASARVVISLTTVADEVALIIDDDGPGIPAEHHEIVFERFGRVDDSRSRQAGGTGLGLAIVKEIVVRHHGSVTISDGPRNGALFCVRLPAD